MLTQKPLTGSVKGILSLHWRNLKKADRGTDIVLHINDDSLEFLEESKNP